MMKCPGSTSKYLQLTPTCALRTFQIIFFYYLFSTGRSSREIQPWFSSKALDHGFARTYSVVPPLHNPKIPPHQKLFLVTVRSDEDGAEQYGSATRCHQGLSSRMPPKSCVSSELQA